MSNHGCVLINHPKLAPVQHTPNELIFSQLSQETTINVLDFSKSLFGDGSKPVSH